ncbi:uncharacterized protein LOC144119925 [Amblyomma americanum]
MARDVQNMRWCGSTMNPLEMAKATRTATNMFFSCKEAIIKHNVKPAIIMELDRLCASLRVCYSIGHEAKNVSRSFEDTVIDCLQKMAHAWITVSPAAPKKYNVDVDEITKSFRRCARRHLSKDISHALEGAKWIKDFISG